MGDFDKKQAAGAGNAANEKRKLIMVGVLGAVLLGVVGFHFMKGGPQAAVAAGEEAAMEPPVGSMTPAQEIAELDPARDPTVNLLVGVASLPADFATAPRNPFRINQQWKMSLVKVHETKVAAVVVKRADPVAQPQAPAVNADSMRLTGIFRQDQKLYASINGDLLTVGMTVGDAMVVDIKSDRVVVRHKDWPAGPLTTVLIQGMKK